MGTEETRLVMAGIRGLTRPRKESVSIKLKGPLRGKKGHGGVWFFQTYQETQEEKGSRVVKKENTTKGD